MKRILFATLITLTLAAGLSAQRGRGGPGGASRDPVAGLKDALGLNDAQVTAITALITNEKTRMDAIRTEVEQKRQSLDSLLSAASPAAIDVGNAAIALHASEAKIAQEQSYLISQIKQQLTGDQQTKLDALIAANGGRGLPLPGFGGRGPGGPGGPPRGGRGPRQQ